MSPNELAKASIEELLQRSREHDSLAFNELFRRSELTLRGWIKRGSSQKPLDEARPSDITQGTFEKVLRGFPMFEGTTAGSWFSWLKTIVENDLAETHKYATRQKRDASRRVPLNPSEAEEMASAEPSARQKVARHEEWRRLFAYIYQLPRDQGDAFIKIELEELSIAEAARQMGGRTESSVTGLRNRGWLRIQKRMRGQELGNTEPQGEAEVAFMEYLRLRDLGHPVDTVDFIARYPASASELREMIHRVEQLPHYKPRAHKKS